MKIGLALSGGGIRATVFHLGVLARLGEEDLLDEITFISTVSGGSLCMGLVFARNKYNWISAHDLKYNVLPSIRYLLTHTSLRNEVIKQTVRRLAFTNRARYFSKVLKEKWGISANLQDLPASPRWFINATCFETGKNWRFERKRMGDYIFGYSDSPRLPLTDAIAASASIPMLIGVSMLKRKHYPNWYKFKEGSTTETYPVTPPSDKVHLWDGALYGNLAVEPLFKISRDSEGGAGLTKFRTDVDFLIISDASRPPNFKKRRGWNLIATSRRVFDVTADQVRSIHSRVIWDYLRDNNFQGRYLQLGKPYKTILKHGGIPDADINHLVADSMSETEIGFIRALGMIAKKLSTKTFERLFRHGYEVANYTLYAHSPGVFKLVKYAPEEWQ